MQHMSKSAQIQLRVSPAQKAQLKQLAAEDGLNISEYILSRTLPDARAEFQAIVTALGSEHSISHQLATLNDLLCRWDDLTLLSAVGDPPQHPLTPYLMNYVAAMIEYVCGIRKLATPAWTRKIEALSEPHFGVELRSLRLHLLQSSPPPFRRRNIFIDSTVGDRV